MERYLKVGERVKIIINSCSSSHKIGSVGIIKCVGYNTMHMSLSTYLIDVDGFCKSDRHWSYGGDLEVVISDLNKNTKVI